MPGGILDLSMSMATMLISITQQGCSRMSDSFFTNATAEMHCEKIVFRDVFEKYFNNMRNYAST